jgi:formate dehydrogenase maturation protein FdhE
MSNRPRVRLCMAIVRVQDGEITNREPKEISTKHLIANKIKTEYNRRHDEFMALGGTRALKTYSDNVARQIAEFKQQKSMAL